MQDKPQPTGYFRHFRIGWKSFPDSLSNTSSTDKQQLAHTNMATVHGPESLPRHTSNRSPDMRPEPRCARQDSEMSRTKLGAARQRLVSRVHDKGYGMGH